MWDNGIEVQQPLLKKRENWRQRGKGATTFIKKREKVGTEEKAVGRAAPTGHKHQGKPPLAGSARGVLFKATTFPCSENSAGSWLRIGALSSEPPDSSKQENSFGELCWAGAHPGHLSTAPPAPAEATGTATLHFKLQFSQIFHILEGTSVLLPLLKSELIKAAQVFLFSTSLQQILWKILALFHP